MRFMLMSLVPHEDAPDPADDAAAVHRRLDQIVDIALLAEELGLDAFGVGERHEAPYLSSSPPVLLSHIAALTSRIRLFTAATTLGLLDPVRACEDYATLDHLADGRLELIVGNGLGTAGQRLFGIDPAEQAERTSASYALFRTLWHQRRVSAAATVRPALDDAEVRPRPLQQPVPVWHAGLSSRGSAERAAGYGEPLVSGNLYAPITDVARHLALYREAWAQAGYEPAAARVGVGLAGVHVAARSQDARSEYRPVFEHHQDLIRRLGREPAYSSYEDYLTRGTAIVGSPEEAREKLGSLRDLFGHVLTYHHADAPGMDPRSWRSGLETYASLVVPHFQAAESAQTHA